MDDITLHTTRRKQNAEIVVELDGDLDVYTAAQLRGELGKALADTGDLPLVLDLRNIGFLDSAGLAALLWAQSARRESRHGMRVVIASGSQPERVFRLAGLEAMMSIGHDTVNVARR
jgi:anti-anti-sigma factor